MDTTRNNRVGSPAFALAVAVVAVLGSPCVATAAPASPALLARALDPNPTLSSYVAAASLSATLHAPIPVHKSFDGTVYYLKPKRKVVFENVSGPLSKFKDLTSTTPSYDDLSIEYAIAPLDDDGTVSTYSLTPKNSGARVTGVKITVDDSAALITRVVWSYSNGGTLRADQTYETLDDFHVLASEAIAARFPGYSVDGTLRFSGYRLNAPVAPSVFADEK